jgi:hypothetical protein
MRVLNSPIVIAILSLSLGRLAASTVASRYQRAQQIFDLRVQGLGTFLDAQASWLHTFLTSQEKENHEDWMQLLTAMRYIGVLFPGTEAQDKFKSYHDAVADLSTHFGLKFDSSSADAEDKAMAKVHLALNDLTKVLVSRLGISEKD